MATIDRFLAQQRRPGLAFLLTDGMTAIDELLAVIRRLTFRRFEVNLVQILSPDEINPDLAGVVELLDSEDRSMVKLTMTKAILTAYEEVIEQMFTELRQAASQHGVHYHRALTNTPFEATVLSMFQAPGAMRAPATEKPAS